MGEFIISFIETIFSLLMTVAFPLMFFGVFGFAIYKGIKSINLEDLNRGERKVLQQDERINLIYQIRKDDPDFSANEVELMILNYAKKKYPNEIFRVGDFNIVDYAKIDTKAQIIYSILSSQGADDLKEYKAVLQMNIKGNDDMTEITKECQNCGAVIENANDKVCPYCGQTYEFEKYNKWKITEVTPV